ncbi:methylmalonyl-CoA mutase family protein [Pseudomonas sp. A014]|uniref:methylmalonyl-CoA mutase family protein n=1 Tax=Pseudomonas sp. A014 TaxID=3458058 RepID=UPI004036ED4E
MRQYTGFANAPETNQRLKEHLTSGAQGLLVAFDLRPRRKALLRSDELLLWHRPTSSTKQATGGTFFVV